MTTTADMYGSMTVLEVAPVLGKDDRDEFRGVAAEQVRTGGRWFILDLGKATGFDSQGLEDLLWFQEEVGALGGVVKVAGLKGTARKIFEVVRFDKKFELFDTVHDAVRSFE